MIDKYMKSAISEQNGSDRRLNEYLSTLKLRLRAFFNDERFSVPFMLRDEAKSNLLSEFIQYMFGILEAKEQHTEGEGVIRNSNTLKTKTFLQNTNSKMQG